MTKKLNDIIGEARSSLRTVADVNEEIEAYLEFVGTLSEEEFEKEYSQLDELSKATLNSYFNKASDKYKKLRKTERRDHTIKKIKEAVDPKASQKDFRKDWSKYRLQKHDARVKGFTLNTQKVNSIKKIKEDITEAKAVSPTLAAKRALQGVADSVGRNKEGHLVARREFFYRHGGTSEKFADEVSRALSKAAALAKAGVKHTVVDHDEHWAPFRGGASVKNSSHWAAHIKVHDGE